MILKSASVIQPESYLMCASALLNKVDKLLYILSSANLTSICASMYASSLF